jgi:excisionase family DNA binding protein
VTPVPRQGPPGNHDLLTPAEVAAAFRVNAKTVRKWALQGKLPAVRTPGGHRRYRAADIEKQLAGWTDAGSAT